MPHQAQSELEDSSLESLRELITTKFKNISLELKDLKQDFFKIDKRFGGD